ncbi:MAG: thrombospondin type 3 repeat-containing protein [Chromatiales bacterium]|nr:thrombospondin type 3 repeat-containing protein [Chromatiales bacterium]
MTNVVDGESPMRYLLYALMLASSASHATLHGRAPLTPGGTDYQAYYDDVLDITWLADGNLVATHAFGVTDIYWSSSFAAWGVMTWDTQQEWIARMNAANYLGRSDWRIVAAFDLDGPDPDDLGNDGCNSSNNGTDCGFNLHPGAGELAHLYYYTLGNIGGRDINGVKDECDTNRPAPPACLTNTGPFTNFLPDHYWTGLECPASLCGVDGLAVEFNARIGAMGLQAKTRGNFAWPVRDGDIAEIPDTDGDGVADAIDNCTQVANPTQVDSDQDGYGNRCDGDLNNDGVINSQDTTLYRQQLGQPSLAPGYNKADINANGSVNSQDTTMFRQLLGLPPGPSGLACAGNVPCP